MGLSGCFNAHYPKPGLPRAYGARNDEAVGLPRAYGARNDEAVGLPRAYGARNDGAVGLPRAHGAGTDGLVVNQSLDKINYILYQIKI